MSTSTAGDSGRQEPDEPDGYVSPEDVEAVPYETDDGGSAVLFLPPDRDVEDVTGEDVIGISVSSEHVIWIGDDDESERETDDDGELKP